MKDESADTRSKRGPHRKRAYPNVELIYSAENMPRFIEQRSIDALLPYALIEDGESRSIDELPMLWDLILAADHEKLTKELASKIKQWNRNARKSLRRLGKKPPKKIGKTKALKQAKKIIRSMIAVTPTRSSEDVLLPCFFLTKHGVETGCELVKRSEFPDAMEYLSSGGKSGKLPSYGMCCVEWKTALGYRVWMKGAFCARDINLFLADAIGEIAFSPDSDKATEKARHAYLECLAETVNNIEERCSGALPDPPETAESVSAPCWRGISPYYGSSVNLRKSYKGEYRLLSSVREDEMTRLLRLDLAQRIVPLARAENILE